MGAMDRGAQLVIYLLVAFFLLDYLVFVRLSSEKRSEIVERIVQNVQQEPKHQEPTTLSKARFVSPCGIDVDKILHFIPKTGTGDCRNLFTTPTSKDITVTPTYTQHRPKFDHIQGKAGLAPEHVKLTLVYQEMARKASTFTTSPVVCEIGFNKGQSALAWLTARDDLKLVSFDIGTYTWTPPAVKIIQELFSDRFEYHEGDSRKTVPAFAKTDQKCDIISIDGGHDFSVVYPDFINMEKLAKKKHIMIADDVDFPGVRDAWNKVIHAKFAKQYHECRVPGIDIDFLIGEYTNRTITF